LSNLFPISITAERYFKQAMNDLTTTTTTTDEVITTFAYSHVHFVAGKNCHSS